ncbi:hypothetical protein MKW92_047511, partial [Papaver armeniacum]
AVKLGKKLECLILVPWDNPLLEDGFSSTIAIFAIISFAVHHLVSFFLGCVIVVTIWASKGVG